MHLQVHDARYRIEVRITARTVVSNSVAEFIVAHHLLTPARYMKTHGGEPF